jgi:hypothetical protein
VLDAPLLLSDMLSCGSNLSMHPGNVGKFVGHFRVLARASVLPHREALALILVKVECRNGRSGSVPIPRLQLEQLEARMDEIADRVARDGREQVNFELGRGTRRPGGKLVVCYGPMHQRLPALAAGISAYGSLWEGGWKKALGPPCSQVAPNSHIFLKLSHHDFCKHRTGYESCGFS